jgi:hypothetical protein
VWVGELVNGWGWVEVEGGWAGGRAGGKGVGGWVSGWVGGQAGGLFWFSVCCLIAC